MSFFGAGALGAKRLQLLHEMVPKAAVIAVHLDPNYSGSESEFKDVEAAAKTLGLRIVAVRSASEHEFDDAFGKIVQAGANALHAGGSAFFTSRRRQLVSLAARHAIPAIYHHRSFVAAGGLMSYGASVTGAYRQAGLYASHILKGAKRPAFPSSFGPNSSW